MRPRFASLVLTALVVAGCTASAADRTPVASPTASESTGKVVRVGLDTSDTPVTSTGVSTLLTGVGQPVAVATALDGALVVGDWASGTFYRIGRGDAPS